MDDDARTEVARICGDLLRIDTSNFGDDTGPGEREAAEYVATLLQDVGLAVEVLESRPRRASVVTRLEGTDPGLPALLVHGHLDVVPAEASDWSVHPFSGEVREGCLWGRGAVDMKGMDAMVLTVLRDLRRRGVRPRRDIVVAFLADEEAGGVHGAQWLVRHRPDLFDGVSEAIGEVGGFSVDIAGRRAYLLQTAEKGIAWLRLTARGRAGHGSQLNDDNAVLRLCEAVTRLGRHTWPLEITPTVRTFLRGVEEITGERLPDEDPDALVRTLGSVARFVGATLRNTSTPTQLSGGYTVNVVPALAAAGVDCRFVPGSEDRLMEAVRTITGPGISVETVHRAVAVEAPFSGALVGSMTEALLSEDPEAVVLPYCLSAGTDAKSFAELGVTCYGFAPLRLPVDLDFAGMFHGVDERVPLDSLEFGVRVLTRFLLSA